MNKIKCIIVDDEREARDRLESLLKNLEYVTIIAKEGDPNIAVEKIIELQPRLIFMDIEMPSKSGFDVVKEVRAQNVNPTFIFVTGYNHYAIKAIRNEAFDYLLKPVDIDELKDSIERYRARQKQKTVTEIPQTFINKYLLSDREIEILLLITQNKSSKEIGEILFISKHTVDTHRRNILEKTGHESTAGLVPFIFNN